MELVRCTTDDGVRLEGLWYEPSGAGRLPLDVVIMHHSVGGNFYAPGFYEDAVEGLTTAGLAVLRANNRGHDIVNRGTGPDGRYRYLGAAFEAMDDCRLDIRAWLDFAQARGCPRAALWGHSLGAVKTLYYASKEGDARVRAAIASSPPRFSHAQYRSDPLEWPLFEAQLREANALIAAGKGDTLMLHVTRPATIVISAQAYVDKYGPEKAYDYFGFIPEIPVPVLLTMGGKEGVVSRPDSSRISLYGIDRALRGLAEHHSHMRYVSIAGGNHWYAGCEAALRDAVIAFLENTL